ncbi:MAG: glycosyltransferase family 39 protein [Thermoanaerobaculia bacterium]
MRSRIAARFLLAAYALAVLSIGITKDWRLLHEDNGAFFSSIALSHLRLGLAETRGHDFFYEPRTGTKEAYGHHPPGLALVLAGALKVTGVEETWVVRSVPILFHTASVFLLVALSSLFLPEGLSLLGGFLLATLPMGAYFGRMPNYEPLGLCLVLVQLLAWAKLRLGAGRRALLLLGAGVMLAGLLDYGPFFFGAAIGLFELIRWVKERRDGGRVLALAACGIGILAFDVAHLWYANHGDLGHLKEVLARNASPPPDFTFGDLVSGLLDFFRRYFTHTGLIASLTALAALLASRFGWGSWSARYLEADGESDPGSNRSRVFRATLALTGGTALAYVAAAPRWSKVHPYWQFYFLPFVVLSILLLVRHLRRMGSLAARVTLVVLALEVLATSTYMLHLRHTREGVFAIETTRMIRERYLAVPPPR